MASAIEIAREYFPEHPDEWLDAIIWGRTGFPEFWPDSTKTPEENFRMQLQAFRDEVDKSEKPVEI